MLQVQCMTCATCDGVEGGGDVGTASWRWGGCMCVGVGNV